MLGKRHLEVAKMAKISIPEFFDAPESAKVAWETFRALGQDEIACEVRRVYGDTGIVIAGRRFFDEGARTVDGWLIGRADDGFLVDFPSGERYAVPKDKVERLNVSAVRP
jgi:hypothetical protein